MKQILVSRDNNSRCRVTIVESIWDDSEKCYYLYRSSGVLNGKMTAAPKVRVVPKSKRSDEEQNLLMYNSLIKKYLDKGYKTIESLGHQSLDTFTEKDLPKENTNQDGIVKPMLCKVYDENDSKSQNIRWLASRKHDGLRTFIYAKDGELHTSSRGGSNYDIAATYILQDAFIKSLFEKYPDLILDGELYNHQPGTDWNLQKISGLGRLETLHNDHKYLKFYCYDIVDEKKTFKERWDFLKKITPTWNSLLVIVEHVEVEGNDAINILHDKWVAEGYEGLVLRDPDKVYKPGSRDRRMQKLKRFVKDSEFKIIGFSEGLRDEDFVFRLLTPEGKEFEAKPVGNRELKTWYLDHMDKLIGEYATVKYFHLTPDGIPNLPVFLNVRDKKDM